MPVNKSQKNKVEKYYDIPDFIEAPINAGQVVGKVRYVIDGKLMCEEDLYVKEDVNKLKTKMEIATRSIPNMQLPRVFTLS